jgi:hypothetical protein
MSLRVKMDALGLLWDILAAYDERNAPFFRFLKRLTSEDNLILVTTSHLLTEFVIDKIIEAKCIKPDIILDDKRNFSYFVKLNTLYCTGHMPENIYHNLVSLNKLRNSYAHNLRPDPKIVSYFSFQIVDGKIDMTLPLQLVKCHNPKDPTTYHNFLIGFCISTLIMIAQYAQSLKVNLSFGTQMF